MKLAKKDTGSMMSCHFSLLALEDGGTFGTSVLQLVSNGGPQRNGFPS
uniref:LRR receptor-like serine/threonine-protein kinase GSO1 n=1 Tax=Rhizophora mucronata TaxID=61149 RepID=A0A2P2L8E5_RHIMU